MKILIYRASNTVSQVSLRRLRLPGDGYTVSWVVVGIPQLGKGIISSSIRVVMTHHASCMLTDTGCSSSPNPSSIQRLCMQHIQCWIHEPRAHSLSMTLMISEPLFSGDPDLSVGSLLPPGTSMCRLSPLNPCLQIQRSSLLSEKHPLCAGRCCYPGCLSMASD